MGRRIRSSLARCLAVLVTPLLVLGCESPGTSVSESPGTSVSAAGHSQQAELTASDGAWGDDFGISVALSASGTTALAGAPSHSGAGAVYVFTLRGGTWSQTAKLTASNGAQYDVFGRSVALSAPGTTALIGASLKSAAYVFAGGGRA